MLDLVAAMMTLGRATHEIAPDPLRETGVSQMFLAMNPAAFGPASEAARIANEVVASLHGCTPAAPAARCATPASRRCARAPKTCGLACPSNLRSGQEILTMAR